MTDDRGIEVPYFGGQEYNRVLSQAAENVSTGYQYLPFEVYARSDFRSTVGKAYKWSSLLRKEQNRLNIIAAGGQVSDTSNIGDALKNTESSDRIKLKGGIALWQKDLKEYGANQASPSNSVCVIGLIDCGLRIAHYPQAVGFQIAGL